MEQNPTYDELKQQVVNLEKENTYLKSNNDIFTASRLHHFSSEVQNKLLNNILNSTDNAILVVDKDKSILYYNTLFLSMWQLESAQMDQFKNAVELTYHIQSLLDNQKDFLGVINEAYYKPSIMVDSLYLKTGQVYEFHSSPISTFGGRLWNIRDISYKKNIEKIRKDNEAHYEGFFLKNRASMLLVDLESLAILDANQAACDYYGYSRPELTKQVLSFIDSNQHSELQSRLLSDDISKSYSSIHTLADGSKKNVEIFTGYFSKDKQNYSYLIILDITNRLAIEKDLILARKRAEESDQLKSSFLANMSHEIRTPMNGILGFSEMLLDPELTRSEQSEYIQIIHNSSQQLLSIINNLVDISKIEAGQMDILEREFDLNEMMKRLFSFFSPMVNQRSLDLFIRNGHDNKHSQIKGDEAKLYQILTNLLGNALKFTHKGFIEFGYSSKDNMLQFYVKDTGIGIDNENKEIIFERFRQVDQGDAYLYGGTGLGLSISQALIEILDGKIWTESELGKGTTFYFTIPYKPLVIFDTIEKTETISSNDWSDKVILVAEDEDMNYYYIQEILRKTKVKLLHVTDGYQAVETCRKNLKLDLVVMDIKLPRMDGYTATEHIKKDRPNLPIIAQTAYALSGEREKSLDHGCDEYLSKPVKRQALMDFLSKYL